MKKISIFIVLFMFGYATGEHGEHKDLFQAGFPFSTKHFGWKN